MKGQPRTKSDTEENQGLANQLQSMDWKWRCFEIIQQKSGRFSDKRRFRKQEEDTLHSEPFTVTYKRYLGGDVAANVTLLSALLIETVQELIPRTDMDYAEKPEISGKTLLLARHELEKCQQTATGDKRLHLQHLNRFVKEEYKDLLLQLERSLIQHSGTWDILWAVLTPGEVVLYECQLTTQKLSGTIVALMKAKEDNVEFWIVKVRVRDWDLQSYKEGIVERKILAYTGNRAFTALEVCPLKFFSDRKELEGRILRQGEIFYKLTMDKVEPRYMDYKGFMTLKKWSGRCWEMKKFPGDGRVMVDLKSFAKMNPGYPMGNAQPSCDLLRGATECSRIPKPDDEQLMRSPAFVYGYSFSRKSWGCFDVCGFSDIKFSSDSFSDLVMPDDVKQMLLKMVRQYVEHSNERGPEVDSIQHKGNGCVIMCYGPPGSGKTLTAESLAEKFERPLYSVNAFELPSTDPSALEEKLLQIFELVHTWRAILLLDEADVYMEKRSSTSVSNNNASTGIFLRQLEYFSGIMFLTTNRPKCFDPAIMSRISMSIRYPALNTGQRSRIWENMLRKAGLQGNIDTSRLGSHPFHGREIRNIISTAKLWGGKDWDMRQVNAVLQMQIKNAKEVEAYEDMSVEFE